MAIELTVPDIGDFTDIPVIEVLVKPGDRIDREAPLVTLESDKATMEIPASAAGTVGEVRVKVGDRVSHGSVLAMLDTGDVAPAPTAPAIPVVATEPHAAPATHGAPAAAPEPAAPTAPTPASASPAPVPASPSPVASNGSNGSVDGVHPAAAVPSSYGAAGGEAPRNGATVHASPALRRFARELGVDLHGVRGTGPNARITREDVQNFVKTVIAAPRTPAPSGPSTAPSNGLHLAPWPIVDFAKHGPIQRVPLSRIKKISGPNLARNWVRIPHVTQFDEADITELETFRKSLSTELKDVKVTMLAFVMKAVVSVLKQFPDFNASLDGEELVLKQYYHLGFAADVPGGLVVPVVRDVDTKGIADIARDTAALAEKARAGKLMPLEMSGATFTISSLGGIGGTAFTPIINAPEVAILGLSRSQIRPRWNGTAFEPRTMLPLSLSYDHRVIDGASAARFTTALSALLADLRRTLL